MQVCFQGVRRRRKVQGDPVALPQLIGKSWGCKLVENPATHHRLSQGRVALNPSEALRLGKCSQAGVVLIDSARERSRIAEPEDESQRKGEGRGALLDERTQ